MNLLPLAFFMLIITTLTVLAIPVNIEKRQSDQRIAELETLLALHKYGVGYGSGSRRVGGRNSPGYGLIDFNYIGRKKKSGGTSGKLDRKLDHLADSASSWTDVDLSGPGPVGQMNVGIGNSNGIVEPWNLGHRLPEKK